MKKLVAISVLFALLTGAAFAEVTFSGGLATGIRVMFGEGYSSPNAIPFIPAHIGNANSPLQLDLNGAFKHSSDKAGGNFQIRARGNTGGLQTDRNAWLWYQPMDMLRISVGILEVGSYNTPSRADARNNVGRGTGIHFDLTPMDGLSFGLTINPNNADTNLRFGVRYQMPEVFVAVANASINNMGRNSRAPINGAPTVSGSPAHGRIGGVDMAFGFNVLALASVGVTELSADLSIAGIGVEQDKNALGVVSNFDIVPTIAIGQRLRFVLGDLSIVEELHVTLQDAFYSTHATGGTSNYAKIDVTVIRAHLGVSYKIDTITPSLNFGLVINGLTNPAADGYRDFRAWDATNSPNAARKDGNMGFIINPNVAFPLGEGGPSVTLGYGMDIDIPKDGDARLNHGIYANFSISF